MFDDKYPHSDDNDRRIIIVAYSWQYICSATLIVHWVFYSVFTICERIRTRIYALVEISHTETDAESVYAAE